MPEPRYSILFCYDRKVIPEYWSLRWYSGSIYVAWYIRHGSVRLDSGGYQLQAGEGDWVFMEPLTTKSHAFTADPNIISIHYRVDWNGLPFFPPLRVPWIYRGLHSDELREAAEELCRVEAEQALLDVALRPSDYALRSALFSRWLYRWHLIREAEAGTQPAPMDRRVAAIIAELGRSVDARPVDYAQLSRAAGLSRAQLNRIFKQSTGLTPKQWKEAACLKIAEDLLSHGELSVKEISARLGFSDSSHFTKWFRGKMNQTPSHWRLMQSSLSLAGRPG